MHKEAYPKHKASHHNQPTRPCAPHNFSVCKNAMSLSLQNVTLHLQDLGDAARRRLTPLSTPPPRFQHHRQADQSEKCKPQALARQFITDDHPIPRASGGPVDCSRTLTTLEYVCALKKAKETRGSGSHLTCYHEQREQQD